MDTFIGIKQTMTQTWDAQGKRLPVTVVKVEPLTVTQVKTVAADKYAAVQVGLGARRGKQARQPLLKHLKKTVKDTIPATLKEIRLPDTGDLKVGDTLNVDDALKVGDLVAISGVSKGHGFAGGVVRWGFKGGPRTHGQSDRERAPGAIGQGTSPGRIHKGKKMAGHYGVQQFTLKNIQIINLNSDTHELWLSGPIPGKRGTVITLRKLRDGEFDGLYQKATPAPEAAPEPEIKPEAPVAPVTPEPEVKPETPDEPVTPEPETKE